MANALTATKPPGPPARGGHRTRPGWAWRRGVEALALAVLGGFAVLHVWSMTPMVFGGPAAFDVSHAWRGAREYGVLVTAALVPVGLLHGVTLVLTSTGQGAWARRYPTRGSWLAALWRPTGVLMLSFCAWHAWDMRWRLGGVPLTASVVSARAASNWAMDALVLGALVSAAHLGLGLWRLCRRSLGDAPAGVQRLAATGVTLGATLLLVASVTVAAAFHDPRFIMAP